MNKCVRNAIQVSNYVHLFKIRLNFESFQLIKNTILAIFTVLDLLQLFSHFFRITCIVNAAATIVFFKR